MIKRITYTLFLLLFACNGQNKSDMFDPNTNDLKKETSPYLLQHAQNPVNWKAWKEAPLEYAKTNNKLLLISVGYAACHWCHVMEHESFENEEVAKIMNDKFVNIKVDREERPDVDQVYMNAVQLMTGRGGWPLNIIALPDGRPVWGGTYFKKEEWMRTINQISELYQKDPEKMIEYASKLEEGIKSLDLIEPNPEKASFSLENVDTAVASWSRSFDNKKGGLNRAPKFMMPNNYHFLLRKAYQTNDQELMKYVQFTLTKMAYGGIYDHVGGGFSRYSVDDKWHVPHFEKMLYDNAQLVSLYADAYLVEKNELYKRTVEESLAFVERELMSNEFAFYSSLDADSLDKNAELEEGAFYVWKKEELEEILTNDFDLFKDYYNINNYGFWEKKNYVLIRNEDETEIAKKHNITVNTLQQRITDAKQKLFDIRAKRVRPRLDDKSLTSWNALMLKAYLDAYRVFGNQHYLDIALKNANFIKIKQLKPDGGLYHVYKDDNSSINGYLEDYAATINAFIALYETTLDVQWLNLSRDLTNYAYDHFYDDKSGFFYFTSDEDTALVSRSIEQLDNVIPASNSIMAKNLYDLALYFGNEQYKTTATNMLNSVKPNIEQYPTSHSNWLDLMLNFVGKYYEVAVVGENAKERIAELHKTYIPNKLIVGSIGESNQYLLENRFTEGETMIYVCVEGACKLPVTEVKDAINQLDVLIN